MLRRFVLCLILVPFLAWTIQAPGQNVTDDELALLLEKVRAQYDVPALGAGVIRKGRDPQVTVMGKRKRGEEVAVTVADRWHLGSNTKPITALLIALLIDLGLLDWDTPLDAIFPEHAEKWDADVKKITPAQLLTHVSGLPTNGPLLGFFLNSGPGGPSEQRKQIVESLNAIKLGAKPGEKYVYSNLGYVVLGAIADARGKATWEEQVQKKIFDPLGIKEWGTGPVAKQPWPHHADGKSAPVLFADNPAIYNSAGRVHLSIADYDRFLAETLRLARGEKGLLKPATAQKFFTTPYPASSHSLSGWLGFRKAPDAKGLVLTHDGSNMFNYCHAKLVPDQGLAFCVMTNQGGPGAKACHAVGKALLEKE